MLKLTKLFPIQEDSEAAEPSSQTVPVPATTSVERGAASSSGSLFNKGTKAIIWGLQTRAVQVALRVALQIRIMMETSVPEWFIPDPALNFPSSGSRQKFRFRIRIQSVLIKYI